MLTRLVIAVLCFFALTAADAVALGGGGGGGGDSGGGQAEDGRRRSLTASPHYLPLPPLSTTVQSNMRARGLLHIEAGLEIPDARLRRRAQQAMPRLRDAYVSALSVYAGVNYRYGDVPDADRIAALLQEATDHALGGEGAELLLGMVMIHAD